MKPLPASSTANKKQVGVCLTPALIDHFDLHDSIVVIIDILRATTTMCVAFDKGMRSIIPVLETDDCQAYRTQGLLTSGERNGIQVEGFDFGNSPHSFMRDDLVGRDLAMTTTNGTKALTAALDRGAKEIVIGAFANFNALAKYLKDRNENVLLFCSAWKDKPNLEDTIFAGAMVHRLRGQFRLHEDTALMAEALYRSANRRKRWYIRHSSHFNRLWHILQIQKDVKFSLRRDTHPVIPIYAGDRLYKLSDLKSGKVDPIRVKQELDYLNNQSSVESSREPSPKVEKISK
ncbi:MAG: 2-phosphosulfolactate phosphatase [Bacteroidia bacterium]|nr:2-phosphosulfolactate phosphatase [Bacteroidia bacterium]